MKKLLLIPALLLSFTATADVNDDCKDISGLAKNVMKTRQTGTSLSAMLTAIKPFNADQNLFKLANGLILDAFEYPLAAKDESREKVINKFENKWHLFCVKTRS